MDIESRLEPMQEWCTNVGIRFTPTYFVNGYQLPDSYKLDDLKQIL